MNQSRARRCFTTAILPVLLVAALLAGCNSPTGPQGADPDGEAWLRLRNLSSHELVAVTTASSGMQERYTRIAPGATTEWRKVGRLSDQPYFEATIDGRIARLNPTGYAGAESHVCGLYTYALDVDPVSGALVLVRVEQGG